MAYLVAHLAWPLILLALAAGAAGWFWHALRTAAETQARDRTRSDVRAAVFALQDEMTPLDTDAAALAVRLRDAEREAADWRRRAAEFEALAAERDERVVELRSAMVDADALRARVGELEAKAGDALAPAEAPVDVAAYEARIAALEADLDAARAVVAEPQALAAADGAAPDPTLVWRLRYLAHRLAWAERQVAAARRPAIDPSVLAERDAARAEAETLRAKLAQALAVTPVSPAEDELNVLRWRARYLDGRVQYLEDRALHASSPPEPAALAAPMPEPDEEDAARAKWRLRYFTSRVAYLEQREKELMAAPQPAPVDPAALQAAQAEIVRVRTAYTQLHGQAQAAVAAANERQARIAALESDLTAALEMAGEADTLRARLRDVEAAHAAAIDPADMTRMGWKARYHEARVTWLEARLAELMAAKAEIEARLAQAPTPQSAPEPERQPAAAVAPPAPAPVARQPDRVLEVEPAAEPRYVWRRVRVLDDPTPSPRDRVVWRRAPLQDEPPPTRAAQAQPPAQQPVFAPPRPPRPAPSALPTIADRPPGLPAPRGGAPDDLRMIAGVGPKIESTLNSLGIYHFDQIAAWTPEQIAWVDHYLSFRGRVSRESWIDQARALARGEETDGKRRYLQGEHV